MMKRYGLLILLLGLLSVAPARAQITITQADVQAYYGAQITSATHYDNDPTGLQGLANATGSNQTWDFRGGNYTSLETVSGEIVSPPVPGSSDPAFASANYINKFGGKDAAGQDSVVYIFNRLDGDGLTVLGFFFQADFDDAPGIEEFTMKYEPGLLALKLPLTFNTSWSSSTNSSIAFPGLPAFTSQIEEQTTCDGWGTLVTPDGSYAAIRCRNVTTTTTEVFPGIPPTVTTSTAINFITKSAVGATLGLDDAGNVISASYTSSTGGGNVAVEEEGLPEGFALGQNYPNPFNPATVIPFTLAEAGHVTLRLYNGLGQEVATLVDGFRPAGAHEVTWRAQGLPSGPYLYRLTFGAAVQSRTLLLQK